MAQAAGAAAQPAVETAESLHSKKQVLLEDKARLQAAIDEEQARLDQQEQQRQQAALMAELEGGSGEPSTAAAAAAEEEDALDAFMSNVETQMEKDKVRAILSGQLSQRSPFDHLMRASSREDLVGCHSGHCLL